MNIQSIGFYPHVSDKILLYELEERFQSPEAELQLGLQQAGFDSEFAAKSQQDLGLDPKRIAEFTEKIPCDAWIVISGSREILLTIAETSLPTLGVFGIFPIDRVAGIGPSHKEASGNCIKELIGLGHQRISMFSRKERRGPNPGPIERILLESLEDNRIPVTDHTLPDWEESLSGFRACLESLFSESTKPTAIIFQETGLVMAVQQFFAQQGIRIPDQVSLFCCDYDPRFEWSVPTIAHSRWDYKEVVQRTLNWAQNVSSGVMDTDIRIMKAEFVPGATIGPPPSGNWIKDTEGKVW